MGRPETSYIMLIVAVSAFLTIFVSMQTYAVNYYVAKDGDDANPGSLSQPWRTISKASAMLQPGDTAYIRSGTYQETIRPERSGTEGNCITYSGYQGEEAVITEVRDGADLGDRSYIILDGLRIINLKFMNLIHILANVTGTYGVWGSEWGGDGKWKRH